MQVTSTCPYWLLRDGMGESYAPLTTSIVAKVAVIGAGITGALTAYRLASAGYDVVVLDKRNVGWGSTSASTALLQYEIDVHLVDLIKKIGVKDAVTAYRLCLKAITTIQEITESLDTDVGFKQKHSLYLASTKKDVAALREEYETRKQHDFRVQWLGKNEIDDAFSFSKEAAILSQDAAQVDAFKLANELIKKCVRSLGVRVYSRTEVESYDVLPNEKVQLTTLDGNTVTVDSVVFATGYETQEHLKQKVVKLQSTYAIATEPVSQFAGWGFDKCLIWESSRPYLYLRTTDDNRIIIGGEDESFSDTSRRDSLIPKKTEVLVDKFEELFPHIPCNVEFQWSGTFGQTKDGLAYIGEHRSFPKAYFILGYGGNGITFSQVGAEIICDLISGQPNSNAHIFRFDR